MNFYQALNMIQVAKQDTKLIDLSAGDPHIPSEVKIFIRNTLEKMSWKEEISRITSYSEYDGTFEFAAKFKINYKKKFNISTAGYSFMVTPGAQAALYYLQRLFEQKGRKILFPVNFEYCGSYNAIENYKASIDLTDFLSGNNDLEKQCLSKINWLEFSAVIISQPHNPTSVVWSIERLKVLSEYISKYNVFLVLDETSALPFAPLTPDYNQVVTGYNVIHIYSFSKVGLAGERTGIVFASDEVIFQTKELQRKILIQTPKIGQLLAGNLIDFFSKNDQVARSFFSIYRLRSKLCIEKLNECHLIGEIIFPVVWGGGLFLWLKCKETFDQEKLLKNFLKNNIAIMPSSTLSVMPCAASVCALRISLGGNFEKTIDAMKIFSNVLKDESRK